MGSTSFVLRQRAFLKLYMLHKAEAGNLYGHQIMEDLQEHFKDLGYRPTKSEVYKSLHDLYNNELISRKPIKKQGTEMQTLYVYQIKDWEKVKAYKDLIKYELDRSVALLDRALQDNYSQKRKGEVAQ